MPLKPLNTMAGITAAIALAAGGLTVACARAGRGLLIPVPGGLQHAVRMQHETPHDELFLDPRESVLHHDRHRESCVEILRHCAWIASP
ncbi:hypothetical protein SAMN04489740_3983 [Arthrobacter alpinus]|uniref:Lipoprotein n=1 Tax=Arthrobacter alpinus TaxID=656366 RepID=A0A1H5P8Z0_9MICC|nr:hypothetical protein SAMN04489740_3983 [Arthrobacter alpinus]